MFGSVSLVDIPLLVRVYRRLRRYLLCAAKKVLVYRRLRRYFLRRITPDDSLRWSTIHDDEPASSFIIRVLVVAVVAAWGNKGKTDS
jgi:hypothetical protein